MEAREEVKAYERGTEKEDKEGEVILAVDNSWSAASVRIGNGMT